MSILDIAQPTDAPAPTNILDAAGSGPDVARARLSAAGDANPDQAAKSLQISDDLGVPAQIIDNDFQNFSKLHEIGAGNALVDSNHFLQTYLNSHPMAARVSKDDLPQLDASSKSVSQYSTGSFLSRVLISGMSAFKDAFDAGGQGEEFGRYQQWLAQNPLFANYFIRQAAEAGGAAATLGTSTLSGLAAGVSAGIGEAYKRLGGSEAWGNRLTRDVLAGIQVAMPELVPEAQVGAAIKSFHDQMAPWAAAEKVPPVGVHPLIDEVHKAEVGIDQQNLGNALTAAQASQTRERSPALFESFIAQHTNEKLGVSADAIRALYGDKVPNPDDGILGWVPRLQEQLQAAETTGGDVEIPVSAFLTHAEPELWNALKDHIRFREGGLTAEEAKQPIDYQEPEKIVSPALRTDKGEIFTGFNHGDAFGKAAAEGKAGNITDGFLTSSGRFLNRNEAATLVGEDGYLKTEQLDKMRQAAGVSPKPQYTIQRADSQTGMHVYNINGPEGDAGHFYIREDDGGKKLYIDDIVANEGAGALGTGAMRDILRQIKTEFPKAEVIEGQRVSGAREAAGTVEKDGRRLIDTRGQGVQYHGTSTTEYSPDEGHYSTTNYYGQGLYTTDAVDVAYGYSKKGSKTTNQRNIFEIKENHPLNIVNAEGPISSELKETLSKTGDDYVLSGLSHAKNLRELYDEIRDEATGDGLSADSIQEIFSAMQEQMVDAGYRGISHKGGLRTHTKEHNVTIYFRPEEDINATKRSFDEFAPQPKATTASVSMRRVVPKQLELPVEGTTRMEDRQPLARPNEQEKKYFRLIAQQADEDRAALQEHLEAAERRQTTQAYRARTEELRPEVEDEIKGLPGLALDEMLRSGKIKLSREGLTDEQIAALPKGYVGADGIHADDLAGVLDHQSGGDLVGDLLNHLREREASGLGPKAFYNKLVKDRLAQRVEGELGPSAKERLDEIKDRVLSETTEDLLHEDTLRAATEAGLQYPIDKNVVKQAILRNYRRLAIGDISSDRFLADAGRAGRAIEASLLKGDAAEAFRQRQRRDWAFMMAREARKTEKAMEQFDRTARRFSAREISSVDQEYTNYIHDILRRVGKQVKRSIQDLEGAIGEKSLAEFAAFKQAHDLREVPIADFLGEPGFKKDFDDLSVDEFEAVHNSIKTLIKNGRDEKTIVRAGEAQDLAAVKAQMVDQLRRFKEIAYDAEGKPIQAFAGVRHMLRTALVSHLQVENVLSRLDRFDPNGVFSQFIYRDLASAANHEAKLLREYSTRLGEIADTANLKERIPNNIFTSPFDKDKPDAQPMAMTRKNLRAVLLNWGNDSNRLKLARGYGVDPSVVQMWLDRHATKADWDWAQKVWDLFSDLHDQSNVMYENLAGVAPESLVVNPITTQHGTYKGGYYPLIRHPTFGEDVKLPSGGLEEQGYVRATTPAGYTKTRTGAIYPLALDLDALPNRLRQIIHDVAFRPSVINAGKIFYDKGIKAEMVKHLGKEYADMFVPWLRDVANVQNFVSSAEKDAMYWSDFMRQNAVTTLVGFNPGTALKHTPTALISSMAEVGPKNFLNAMRSLMSVNETTGESNWRFAMNTSEELQRRSRNWTETMGGGLAALENRAGVVKSLQQGEVGAAFMSLREAITELSSKPVALGDLLSAVPTWMAQYDASMADHGIHGDAIAEADRAVRRAHGSSAITSRPAVARSRSVLGHWMTGFFTFFNDLFNRQVETLWRAGESYDLAKQGQYGAAMGEAAKVGGRLFAYVIAPAMIEELVSPMTNKDHESWGEMAAKSLLFTLSSSWIGIRDIVSAMLNKRDPSVGLLSTAEKSISDVVRDMTTQRMKAGNVIKHGTQLGGMLTGLTPAPIGRAAEFAISGEHPRGPWGWATGLRYGTLRGHAPTFQQWMRGR